MPGETIGFELIVGLGNPGSEYAETRHNAGFWFVDELARQSGCNLKPESKFFGEAGKAQIGSRSVHLLKPMDFMNNSGRSVGAFARFYKIPTEKILVAYDELDLSPGTVRVKKAGGHGGHNGMRDIIQKLGSSDFWRLRIGIGHPGHKSAVANYVLKRASAADQRLIEEVVDLGLREADRLVGGDINEATKALHSHKPPQE